MIELTEEEYQRLLKPLTKELSAMARWVAETGQRIVVLFEGRDTAGKGGSIDMIARVLNPRQCHVVALSSPNERERGQWYFQRYAAHLPAKGEIALFDRSWYNRAGVEPVMGYCSPERDATPSCARSRSSSGTSSTTASCCSNTGCAATRRSRSNGSKTGFAIRSSAGSCRRSISTRAAKYEAYTDAREKMLAATHTDFAPWTLVDFNDQALGRLTLLRDLLDRIPDTDLPLNEIPTGRRCRGRRARSGLGCFSRSPIIRLAPALRSGAEKRSVSAGA